MIFYFGRPLDGVAARITDAAFGLATPKDQQHNRVQDAIKDVATKHIGNVCCFVTVAVNSVNCVEVA